MQEKTGNQIKEKQDLYTVHKNIVDLGRNVAIRRIPFRDKHKRYAIYADSTCDLLGQLGGRNWNYTKKSMQNSYIPAPSTVSFSTEYQNPNKLFLL